jgi:hypothetical protein
MPLEHPIKSIVLIIYTGSYSPFPDRSCTRSFRLISRSRIAKITPSQYVRCTPVCGDVRNLSHK